jgi:iron complex transport system permease protein
MKMERNENNAQRSNRGVRNWGLLLGGMVLVFLLSLFIGRYPQPFWMPPHLIGQDELARQIILALRLPRLIAALLMGASLAVAGNVLQMVFRNPLVGPGFLGVSQGASFGAALSILLRGSSTLAIEVSAAIFAFLGLILSYFLARHLRYGGWVLRLILSGIAVSALFSAGNGLLKYFADPLTQLPDITFWLLGGLWSVTWREVLFILPLVTTGLVMILLMRWRLNILSLSEETAFSLGTRMGRERALLLTGAVAATAAVTAVGGMVGWVGLIVPHLARRLFGASAQRTIPATIVMGGIFVLICDNLARSLQPGEIPLGIITSLLGALIFVLLMIRAGVRFKP